MGKWVDDTHKEVFIEQYEDYLIQLDENSATFEFGGTIVLKSFLEVLDMVFSDYQIRIVRTAGHPTIQVFMKLEEGLWKPK